MKGIGAEEGAAAGLAVTFTSKVSQQVRDRTQQPQLAGVPTLLSADRSNTAADHPLPPTSHCKDLSGYTGARNKQGKPFSLANPGHCKIITYSTRRNILFKGSP